MPKLLSDALGVSRETLGEKGAFNGFVDLDSKLYVDPFLLKSTGAPELHDADALFERHFKNILTLLKAADGPRHAAFRSAIDMLTFPEPAAASLGYANAGTGGSGIGKELAARLTSTAKEIVDAGVVDPEIFQLVGLIEENVGPDRISDMTIRIILEPLYRYSARIAAEVAAPTTDVFLGEDVFELPYDAELDVHVVLLPQDLLRSLPVAKDWTDVDQICAENAALRAKVNHKIGDTWRLATHKAAKRELREALLKNPEVLKDLIEQYRDKNADPYDLHSDPEGHLSWYDIGTEFAAEFPLALTAQRPTSRTEARDVVLSICEKFGELIEKNGLNAVLWDADGSRRNERFAQLLFYAVADSYCSANNLDLSREPNAGRGPVDFKVTRGQEARITVEIKYTSNSHLKRGFENQLPLYNAAERTHDSIFLVIQNTESINALERVQALRRDLLNEGREAPDLILVDGRSKPSASKV